MDDGEEGDGRRGRRAAGVDRPGGVAEAGRGAGRGVVAGLAGRARGWRRKATGSRAREKEGRGGGAPEGKGEIEE